MTPRSQAPEPWHVLSRDEIEQQLETGPDGLTDDAARSRLTDSGPNELQAGHKISALAILLAQFQNVVLVIRITPPVVSALLGHGTESIVIGVIVLFAVGLGFVQEYRAERAIE